MTEHVQQPQPPKTDGTEKKTGPASRKQWMESEVVAIVGDYLEMLLLEASGQPYSKTEHRRDLAVKLDPERTKSSIEFKHQNISAAMIDLGLPYILGYLPRDNYQAALRAEVQRRLDADPALLRRIMQSQPHSGVGDKLQRTAPPSLRSRTRAGRHIDYGVLQEENRRVGELGENLVVDYERDRLRTAGCSDLADNVRWVSKEDGDGLGFDVLSFEETGEKLYIEVKATALAAETPFYMSSAELDFVLRHTQAYALYRVSRVNERPQFFVLRGPGIAQLDKTPVTYQMRLPRERTLFRIRIRQVEY